MLIETIYYVNSTILLYFIILSVGYIFLLILSIPDILLRFREVTNANVMDLMHSYSLPPMTVIIPAYNEEHFICEMVQSILQNKYLNTFIIIINDGSTDQTLKKLIETYHLHQVDPIIEKKIKNVANIKGQYISLSYKNLMVIDKEHTDRSDSLNMGVNACRTPFLMTVDADTLIEEDTISRVLFYMLSRSNMVAAGGGVYVLNGSIFKDGQLIEKKMSLNPLYAFQTCEYLRSFLFSKSGWNSFGGSLCYSGAFTAFKHASVIEVGGFEVGNLAQDFEIITHFHANKYDTHNHDQLGYIPAATVWTDVPGTLKQYWKQRFNWQYATLQSLMSYKKMLFNPKYGIVGLFTYPFFLFGETLGAIVEFTAYLSVIICLALGLIDLYTAALFFIVCWGFLAFMTIANMFINFITFNKYNRLRDLILVLFFTAIEGIGFRQFNVICRVSATFAYIFRKRSKR